MSLNNRKLNPPTTKIVSFSLSRKEVVQKDRRRIYDPSQQIRKEKTSLSSHFLIHFVQLALPHLYPHDFGVYLQYGSTNPNLSLYCLCLWAYLYISGT